MGYSEKLEQSMKNFDREVDKLTKINDLVKEIDGLTEVFLEESKNFQDSVKRLTELKAGVEKDCALLSKFTTNETAARQKLLADVHEKIIMDSRQIINDIADPLNVTNAELQKTCKEIDGFITLHKKSQEKFLSDTENLLVKYNTKNLETYNNLLASLSNKIDIAKGAVENLLANQDNLLADISRQSDKNKRELEKSLMAKLEEQNQKLSEEVATLKEKISVLSYIKAATTAAAGFGILSCIIHFIR